MNRISNPQVVTLAGWTTTLSQPAFLMYLHPLPRPYSYLAQLIADAQAYKPWLFWIGGGGLIAHGAYSLFSQGRGGVIPVFSPWQSWINIIFGTYLLLSWLRGFIQAVHWTRTAPLDVGVIKTLKPLPPWPDLALADALQADGTSVEVTVFRAFVAGLLKEYGQCEVLFYKRPHPRGAADTGFVIAARMTLEGEDPQGDELVLHWTSLPAAKRLDLQQIARKVGYPVDAVFFVLSALGASLRQPDRGQERRPADGHGGERNVPARELCRFVPEQALFMFGTPAWASRILSAWGLRKGEDVGAIVMACVEAGWMKAAPGESVDDFRGIDLLSDLRQKRPK
jgi:uncharacterized repeat protein (TIGR04138 family)